MLDPRELDAESAELLPGREALTRFSGLSFTRTLNVSKHIAHVDACNTSLAQNNFSPDAIAQSSASQSISIRQ